MASETSWPLICQMCTTLEFFKISNFSKYYFKSLPSVWIFSIFLWRHLEAAILLRSRFLSNLAWSIPTDAVDWLGILKRKIEKRSWNFLQTCLKLCGLIYKLIFSMYLSNYLVKFLPGMVRMKCMSWCQSLISVSGMTR